MRGRKPKPKEVRKLSNPEKARLMNDIPEPPVGAPIKPDWLGEIAAEVWDITVDYLLEMRCLARVDQIMLIQYCQTYQLWREAQLLCADHGLQYMPKDKNKKPLGALKPYPHVIIASKLNAELLRLGQEFGLSPVARTRIDVKLTAAQKGKIKSIVGALKKA